MSECAHTNIGIFYDHAECKDCGAFRSDSCWGSASNMWFKNRAQAEYYKNHGCMPPSANDQDPAVLAQRLAAAEAELARVSEELGLPPNIGPAPGYLAALTNEVSSLHSRLEGAEKDGTDVSVALAESKADDYWRLVQDLREGLQEIYAQRGEDELIASIACHLIDKSAP